MGFVKNLQHNGNITAMDLGKLHTSCVIWRDKIPISLDLFAANNCHELIYNLENNFDQISNCSMLLVERQMGNNFGAQQIQGWIEMWLALRVPTCKFVLFPSRLKYTRECKGYCYSKRKKWAVEKAKIYLKTWPEQAAQFATFKPQADVADALIIGMACLS